MRYDSRADAKCARETHGSDDWALYRITANGALFLGCPRGLSRSAEGQPCRFPQSTAGLRASFGPSTTAINIDTSGKPKLQAIIVGALPDLCTAFPNITQIRLVGLTKMDTFAMPAWLSKCNKLEALILSRVNLIGEMASAHVCCWFVVGLGGGLQAGAPNACAGSRCCPTPAARIDPG